MVPCPQIIRYLRDCYEADNRETGIANLLARKYRHVTFLTGTEDLLRGVLDQAPVEREAGLAAAKEASLYRKDKTLVYAAIVLAGPAPDDRRLPARLCAPLVFYPAEVRDHGGACFVAADLAQQRVNFPVLAALAGQGEAARSAVEALVAQVPPAPWNRDAIHCVMSLLTDVLPGIDALPLAAYPRLAAERDVRRAMRSEPAPGAKPIQCLPAAALALAPNSPDTRGVLFELGQMAEQRELSAPVRALLGDAAAPETRRPDGASGRVPAVLSRAQQDVLRETGSRTLTLVVGPPGTGKSYTIAALALDHLSRGQSVLVASRMEQAVDVVGRKIEEMLGPSPCVVRGGRREHLRELKKSLDRMLHGMARALLEETPQVGRAAREFARAERGVLRLERRLRAQIAREEQWGLAAAGPAPAGFLGRALRRARLGWLDWRLGAAGPLWDLTGQYQRALDERVRAATGLLRQTAAAQVRRMLQHHRGELTGFLGAIRARSDVKQEKLFARVRRDVLYGTFPIWLVTLADVSAVVPFECGLFDLAIIDEATQCDVASCLPVLQRARRAVVVGDPNQLRHVSFLSGQRQAAAAAQRGLDAAAEQRFHYRQKSVLDVVSESLGSQQGVLFLDEHFRSTPQIIAFSNREFYGGSLRVMTARPATDRLRCVELRRVPGGRNREGTNREEARAVADEVLRRVEAQAELPAGVCHSLGVLSPFRDQVDHVQALLQKEAGLEALRRHDVMVGTAHSFQGEERDVMLLSLVVDAESHPASLRFLNQPDVFNVSVTRARDEQVVFCSLGPEDLKADSLLRRYLAGAREGPPASTAPPPPAYDAFLGEVRGELVRAGFAVHPGYPVAGLPIDLVVQRGPRALGIDLIGYPGETCAALDLERYRVLRRAGLTLFPLSYRAWRLDRAACLAAVGKWQP